MASIGGVLIFALFLCAFATLAALLASGRAEEGPAR